MIKIILLLATILCLLLNAPVIIREIHLKRLYLLKESQSSNWPKAFIP